jgi:hypothetical protein
VMLQVHVELNDDTVHVFDTTPDNTVEWIRAYVERSGDGLHVEAPNGVCFWPWAEVLALKVVAPHENRSSELQRR